MVADGDFERTYLEPFAWAPIFMLARSRGVGAIQSESSFTVEQVAERLLFSRRGAEMLMQQLRIMELVAETDDPGDFVLTSLGRRLLEPSGSPEVIAPMVAFYKDVIVRGLASLFDGAATDGLLDWPPSTTASSRKFEDLMNATSPYVAAWLDELLDFENIESILDVGGGDGTVCALLCQKHENLRAEVFNLPIVEPLIRETSHSAGLQDRLIPVAGDFRKDALPKGYRVILFSRMLSDWSDEVVERLLTFARDSLSPGGMIVIIESNLGPENNRSDSHAWAIFWELFVSGLPLHGPRTEAEWRTLAGRAGLDVELMGRCGRLPFPELVGLSMRTAEL